MQREKLERTEAAITARRKNQTLEELSTKSRAKRKHVDFKTFEITREETIDRTAIAQTVTMFVSNHVGIFKVGLQTAFHIYSLIGSFNSLLGFELKMFPR